MATGHRITTTAENPLCIKLQKQYYGRVSAALDSRRREAEKRPESPRKAAARNIATPFSDTLEFVPATARNNAKYAAPGRVVGNRPATGKNNRSRPVAEASFSGKSSDVRSADKARRRVEAYEKTTPFRTGVFSRAYTRAADIRARAYDGSEAEISERRSKERAEASKPPRVLSKQWLRNTWQGRSDEESVYSRPVSKGVVVTILLVSAVILMILFSFSEINSFKKDISALEQNRLDLTNEIEQLELDIDRKNDVRTIEQIATEEIGMVKRNRVQSKYISLSEGDRVEVVDGKDNSEEDYGIFATLLSTFGKRLDTLRDYIE